MTSFKAVVILRPIILFFSLLVLVDTQAQISADETEGCAPLTSVVFSHSYGSVSNILWDFGDLVSSGLDNPTHSYQNPGVYSVTFTADGGISDN
jgi:PKD repeat protein